MAMEIHKSYTLAFPVEKVYKAWVSSETVIAPATGMDVVPVVGDAGHYKLIMELPDYTGKAEGKFSTIEPNKHVVYTWEWNGDGEVTTIDVKFAAGETENTTFIELAHTGFVKQESLTNHDNGWDSYIEGFTKHLSGL